ncbi:hypothetical protein [Parahaliea maris]|uniref:hypothetical protein n=1 Tax=Parahaliea maris TaxID=2716870 RepID=UPI00164F29A9|nr:hypothetical protein [Parahaliea maris]
MTEQNQTRSLSIPRFPRVSLRKLLLLAPLCLAQPAALGKDALPLCRALPPLPGSVESPDLAQQREQHCDVDLNNNNTAICAKTWSTSPAALIYALEGTAWAGRVAEFEREVCPRGTRAIQDAHAELGVFKHSMNGRKTSATYAPASLLYHHLGAWLGLRIHIPIAVELQFPVDWYRERVVSRGLKASANRKSLAMLHAAWVETDALLASPQSHSQAREVLTPDRTHIWGASLLFTGKRYGPEVSGTRASGWGKGQNYDFQKTPEFIALRSEGPLQEAVTTGIARAVTDHKMELAIEDATPLQVAWWAGEVAEIVVMDYLLGQQDRIGNIDYQWRWLWQDANGWHSTPHKGQAPPEAQRLRVTWLNDNDAGIRGSYANFARSTGMINGLRHFDPTLYRRLRLLGADFATQGPVYQAIASDYHLPDSDLERIGERLQELLEVLGTACSAGELRFDLAPEAILGSSGKAADVSCDA